jgi:hypothetical protein
MQLKAKFEGKLHGTLEVYALEIRVFKYKYEELSGSASFQLIRDITGVDTIHDNVRYRQLCIGKRLSATRVAV